MTSASSLVRSLLIYSICLPVAVFLGYLIAQPADFSTFMGIGMVLFFLALPMLLRWHHLWLVASWNMMAVLFFLPGRPFLWLSMAWFGFTVAIIQYILNRRQAFLSAPSITRPLLFLVVVVLATAKLTGGIGLQSFGSETQGGKRYILMLSSIVGYFALVSQPIPRKQVNLYVGLFFLGAITAGFGELAPLIPSALYSIFLIFPVTDNAFQMISDPMAGSGVMARLGGLAMASSACFCVILARYGIRDTVSLRRPGRLFAFTAMVGLTLLGGYRSALILILLTCLLVFYLEGLFRSRLLPLAILVGILGTTLMVSFVDRLPLSMQRSLSFLPIDINPIARISADATTEWRVNMWKRVLPEIPHHLLLGKGYAINAHEAEVVLIDAHSGGDSGTASSELSGDYHNGPLSVILPFGIPGVIAVLWFFIAGWHVLWRNYKFGDPAYNRINTFLLAYYIAQIVMFFVVFGSLYTDFVKFTGLIGLSVSLNGGVAGRAVVPPTKIRYKAFEARAALRRRRPIGATS